MKTEADYIAHYAETSGRDALANALATMQCATEELDRYIARYDELEQLKDKANVLNWALSHLATYIPNNVRLDMIAGAQAELLRATATKLKHPSGGQEELGFLLVQRVHTSIATPKGEHHDQHHPRPLCPQALRPR